MQKIVETALPMSLPPLPTVKDGDDFWLGVFGVDRRVFGLRPGVNFMLVKSSLDVISISHKRC